MTSSNSWKNAENYSYLLQLEGRDHAAGWAWEFIRRSIEYRKAYAGFESLRKQFGALWRAEQPKDNYYPEKKPNESESAWKFRVSGHGHAARRITASQKSATKWMLFDLYDPEMKYKSDQIYFALRNPYPAFYSSQPVPTIPSIGPFEDIAHDFLDDSDGILFVALDATRPSGEQLTKVRVLLDQYAKLFESKKTPSKGQQRHWITYLQFLDARDAHPTIKLIDILDALDVDNREAGRHELASQRYESARKMTTHGYKGLLFAMEMH